MVLKKARTPASKPRSTKKMVGGHPPPEGLEHAIAVVANAPQSLIADEEPEEQPPPSTILKLGSHINLNPEQIS